MVAPYSGQLRYVWDEAAGQYFDLYQGTYVGTSIPTGSEGSAVEGSDTTFRTGQSAPVGQYQEGSTQAPERPGYTDTLAPNAAGTGSTGADYGYITHWDPQSGPQGGGAYELNPVNPETGVPYTGTQAYDAGIDLLQPLDPNATYGENTGTGTDTGYGTTSYGDSSGGGGYDGYGYDDYSQNRYGSSGSSGGSSGGRDNNYQQERPRYGDGSLHPAWGGDPRVPGGRFNDGYSSRKTAEQGYPGSTPSAGQWGARSAGPALGGGGDSSPANDPSYSSSGGGGRSALWWELRNKALGAVGGATGGSTSGGGTSGYPPPETAPPTDTGSGAAGDTGMRKLRGWAGRQGYNPATLQETVYYSPEALFPDVVKGLDTDDAFYSTLEQGVAPHLNNLWMASSGSQRGNLGAPDQQANWINKAVDAYTDTTGGKLWDTNKLVSSYLSPDKKSANWMGQSGQTFGQQAYQAQNVLGSVFDMTMNPLAATATASYLDSLLDAAASKNLKRGPNRQIDANRYIKRRLF